MWQQQKNSAEKCKIPLAMELEFIWYSLHNYTVRSVFDTFIGCTCIMPSRTYKALGWASLQYSTVNYSVVWQ